MTPASLIEHQILSSARAREGESFSRTRTSLGKIFEDTPGEDIDAAWRRIVEAGHIRSEDDRVVVGDGIDAAIARRVPPRRDLTVEDLEPWTGKMYFDRVDMNESPGSSPWGAAAFAEIMSRRVEGALEKVDIAPGRARIADDWNAFVDTGILHRGVQGMVMDALASVSFDFRVKEIDREDLPLLASRMNEDISEGFGRAPASPTILPSPECRDRVTGDILSPRLSGSSPAFFTRRPEDNFEERRMETSRKLHDGVSLSLPAGEILAVAGRGGHDAITEALHKVHVDHIGLPDTFNADQGAEDHARDTLAETGVMAVSLGDEFPRPVIDRETGRAFLVSYTDVVRDGHGDPGDIVVGDNHDAPDMIGLEFLSLTTRQHLVATMESVGIDRDSAEGLVSEEIERGDAIWSMGHLDEAHIVIPRGRAVSKLDAAAEGSGVKTFEGGRICAILSPDPVVFDARYDISPLGAEAPRLESDTPTP